jgi:ribosomal-protein-alanine N-acetyltransferase
VALETLTIKSITIKSMQPGDIAKVLELEKRTLAAWSEDHLKDELQQPTGFQFVVSNKTTGRILAVLFGRIVLHEAEILKLSVVEFVRNRGVGYQLLDFVVNYCGTKGVKTCYLELRSSNEAAMRLYEKRGFVTVGTRRNYYNGPVEDGVLMQYEL